MSFQFQSKQLGEEDTSWPEWGCLVLHKGWSVWVQNTQGPIHKSLGLQVSSGFMLTEKLGLTGF